LLQATTNRFGALSHRVDRLIYGLRYGPCRVLYRANYRLDRLPSHGLGRLLLYRRNLLFYGSGLLVHGLCLLLEWSGLLLNRSDHRLFGGLLDRLGGLLDRLAHRICRLLDRLEYWLGRLGLGFFAEKEDNAQDGDQRADKGGDQAALRPQMRRALRFQGRDGTELLGRWVIRF